MVTIHGKVVTYREGLLVTVSHYLLNISDMTKYKP